MGLSDYELMRLSEEDEEDAFDPRDFEEAPSEDYFDFYDDVKGRNTTKLDW